MGAGEEEPVLQPVLEQVFLKRQYRSQFKIWVEYILQRSGHPVKWYKTEYAMLDDSTYSAGMKELRNSSTWFVIMDEGLRIR